MPGVTDRCLPHRLAMAAILAAVVPALGVSLPMPPGAAGEAAWWVSATASGLGLAAVGLAALAQLRPPRRQLAWVVVPLMLLMVDLAWLNEHLLKPAMASPRPNLVWLAGSDGAAALYAQGDKQARSRVLAQRLTARPLGLSDRVRAHWIAQTGYSFPSGHSLMAGLLAGWFLYWAACRGLIRRLWWLAPWAAAVAWSRLVLGVHRPVDVLAGLALGLLASWATAALIRRQVSAFRSR